MTESDPVPNKTIYVADADQPLFERAQELAGGNLSAAIAQALRRYVADADQGGEDDVIVTVNEGGVSAKKRFQGRLLGRQTVETPDEKRSVTYRIYLTKKGRYAVWSKNSMNWMRRDWPHKMNKEMWATSRWWESESRLDVYETLEDLRDNIPGELYQRIARISASGSDVEVLDI